MTPPMLSLIPVGHRELALPAGARMWFDWRRGRWRRVVAVRP